MRNLCIVVLFSFFHSQLSLAQEAYDFTHPPSPSVGAIIKPNYFKVSPYTGKPGIYVPVHSFESKGMSMNISMSYDAGGIKLNQHAGWVGQNWSLSAGGVISRTVNGVFDEYFYDAAGPGNCCSYFNGVHNSVFENVIVPVSNSSFFCDMIKDYEQSSAADYGPNPDIFSFNFMGYSGRFHLDRGGTWRVQSDQNIQVEFELLDQNNFVEPFWKYKEGSTFPFQTTLASKVIAGFVLTDDKGNRYTFGMDQNAIEYSVNPSESQTTRQTISNSWHLTKVENIHDEVIFSLEYNRGWAIANLSN